MKRQNDALRFSATDLSNGLGCGHLSELDHQVTLGALVKPMYRDPVLEALWQQGLAHEGAYLANLRARGLEVVAVGVEGGEQSAIEQTRQLMERGTQVIYQAHLADGAWGGRADFLMRVNAASKLGAYSYQVVDTKLASETRAGTILQLFCTRT
jgi:hypothetical protein